MLQSHGRILVVLMDLNAILQWETIKLVVLDF